MTPALFGARRIEAAADIGVNSILNVSAQGNSIVQDASDGTEDCKPLTKPVCAWGRRVLRDWRHKQRRACGGWGLHVCTGAWAVQEAGSYWKRNKSNKLKIEAKNGGA